MSSLFGGVNLPLTKKALGLPTIGISFTILPKPSATVTVTSPTPSAILSETTATLFPRELAEFSFFLIIGFTAGSMGLI